MVILENAKKSFAAACGNLNRYNSESEFYHKIAEMIPERIDVDNLILAFKIALRDEDRRNHNTVGFIALAPMYVDQCENPEFALEFREKYNREILGLTIEKIPDDDYGCVEIDKDIVDISNKSKGAVLAALYNHAVPLGKGFMQYNPLKWTSEMGEAYFDKVGEKNGNGGTKFRYVLGRCLDVLFVDGMIYVAGYNYVNGSGMAQRIIATVPNLDTPKVEEGKGLKK